MMYGIMKARRDNQVPSSSMLYDRCLIVVLRYSQNSSEIFHLLGGIESRNRITVVHS
jgi:hypothetical protein